MIPTTPESSEPMNPAVGADPPAEPEPAPTAPVQRLDCLEVWGGSKGMDTALAVTGLDVWAWSQPADTVAGGDLCFVSMCACAEVSRFLVADVTGHDAESARIADRLRRLMRRHINKPDQSRLAGAINRDFDGMARHGKFATALLATFFPPTRHLMICNAGHPRPLWYQTREQRWTFLDPHDEQALKDVTNLPFGIVADTPYAQFAVKLSPGDQVLIHTDGLTEATTRENKMLGEKGLRRLIESLDPAAPHELLPRLRSALRRRTDGRLDHDDLTVLQLRANGGQPTRKSITQRLKLTARMLGLASSYREPDPV